MDGFEIYDVNGNKILSLLMLECGFDNFFFKVGSECVSGSEVLLKIREKRCVFG